MNKENKERSDGQSTAKGRRQRERGMRGTRDRERETEGGREPKPVTYARLVVHGAVMDTVTEDAARCCWLAQNINIKVALFLLPSPPTPLHAK